MTWLISFVVALICGVAGLLLAGFIANACTSWYHVSSREGAAGYFVMFMGLGGGIAGIIVGLITARIAAGQFGPGFGKELGCALGVVLLIGGVSALLCRLFADVAPEIDGRDLMLEVEFRFPNTAPSDKPPTADGEWLFRFASLAGHTQRKVEDGKLHGDKARLEAGRWIVPAEVYLFTERGRRVIDLQRNGQDAGGFLVSLPARPDRKFLEWSGWLPIQQANGQPWPADKLSYRFRAQKTVPPPPPKTQAEYKAEEAAAKEAEFVALPPDAPLERLLPYLDYEQPQTERAAQRIAARPNLLAELSKLALDNDPRTAEKALRCLEKLPVLTPEFIPPVEAVGRDLAERIRKVNATTVEEDPSYHGAADVSIRFSAWMCAARALRAKCGGDFTKELKPILELSRVRPDSYVMRADVCRVASYYLHQWAGIEPLPTDPKPK